MAQQVITGAFQTTEINAKLDVVKGLSLQAALNDGWQIISSSSAILPVTGTQPVFLYVAFVLEKH